MDILLLDRGKYPAGLIQNYTSLVWTERYNGIGDCELIIPANIDDLSRLQIGSYLEIPQYIQPNQKLHPFLVTHFEYTKDIENNSFYKIYGKSYDFYLENRVQEKTHWLNGDLQSQLEILLKDTCLDRSDYKNLPGFKFLKNTTSPVSTANINAYFTGESVYNVIYKLCDLLGFGHTFIDDTNSNTQLYIYSGVERNNVVFDFQLENVYKTKLTVGNPIYKNVAVVAGEGEGVNRKYAVVTSTPYGDYGIFRRELFVDARDIQSNVNGTTMTPEQYIEVLKTRGLTKLKEFSKETIFEADVNAFRPFSYGVDFYIGDVLDLLGKKARIEEVTFSASPDSLEIFPSFKYI